MICWNRNYGFLRDPFYSNIINDKEISLGDKSIVWRTYILVYFAKICSKLVGDYLELGTYEGHTAQVISEKIDFNRLEKNYILYDLFEWKEGDYHSPLDSLKNKIYILKYVKNSKKKIKILKLLKGGYQIPWKILFQIKLPLHILI